MITPELRAAYLASVKEADRMERLLERNKVKSTGDWRQFQRAIMRRDALLSELLDRRSA